MAPNDSNTQTAVVVGTNDAPTVWSAAPVQALQPNEFSIRTEAVGVNPSDTKMRGPFATAQGILGTDYAGTVVAVGTDVTDVAVGDRVAGAQNAQNAQMPERGSFRALNVNAGKVWLKLPEGMSTEAGATFGAGISTAGLALKLLGLPLPDEPVEKPVQVLVYGGSTATGTMAMQLLKLANLIPIATCSPRNFELAQSYGAAKVFDYREKDCAQHIRDFTKNNLRYTLDCITTPESTAFCFAAMGRAGGKYVSLDPFAPHAATRKMVKTDWVLGPSIFGEGSTWPAPYGRPPSDEIRAYGEKLWTVAQRLVDEGKLRNHPLRVLEGGWEKVLEGMDLVKSGKLSGEKVVVKLL